MRKTVEMMTALPVTCHRPGKEQAVSMETEKGTDMGTVRVRLSREKAVMEEDIMEECRNDFTSFSKTHIIW